MSLNVMLDLETMGNGSRAAIVAIGAVAFDPATGVVHDAVGEVFYARVSLESSVQAGLKIDASTVLWWLKQSDAARQELTSDVGVYDLRVALEAFARWYAGCDHDAPLWGNGATFDNVVLANAYRAVGTKQPWNYKADRCFRTLKELHPHVPKPADIGTAHNAVDDARFQARWAIEILQAMGKEFR